MSSTTLEALREDGGGWRRNQDTQTEVRWGLSPEGRNLHRQCIYLSNQHMNRFEGGWGLGKEDCLTYSRTVCLSGFVRNKRKLSILFQVKVRSLCAAASLAVQLLMGPWKLMRSSGLVLDTWRTDSFIPNTHLSPRHCALLWFLCPVPLTIIVVPLAESPLQVPCHPWDEAQSLWWNLRPFPGSASCSSSFFPHAFPRSSCCNTGLCKKYTWSLLLSWYETLKIFGDSQAVLMCSLMHKRQYFRISSRWPSQWRSKIYFFWKSLTLIFILKYMQRSS